jgi:hypothetical protein
MQQDELQVVFNKYCSFVENEVWHQLNETASTVDHPDREILLDLVVAGVLATPQPGEFMGAKHTRHADTPSDMLDCL